MKITFITTGMGVFGSIRELIENANRLVKYGHDVIIRYNTKKYPFNNWLPCLAKFEDFSIISDTDILIMWDSPFDYHMDTFKKTNSKFKTFCMMGFDPDTFQLRLGNKNLYNMAGTKTESNLLKILNNYEIIADAQWQLDFFTKNNIRVGVPIGGINLKMFHNKNAKRTIDVAYSGDARPRKGTNIINNTVLKLTGINAQSYFNKGNQKWLVNFLNQSNLFIDNHLRAGWCNPVLEAMSCGCVAICNDIPAVTDFAIHNKTAIVLKENNEENFYNSVIDLLNNKDKTERLRSESLERVKLFDYNIVSKRFEQYLLSKI